MLGDALFAGFLCGHILALIFSPLAAIVLTALQPKVDHPYSHLPSALGGLPPVLLAVPVFMLALTASSALGLLFALLFVLLYDEGSAGLPGLPSPLYTAIVFFFTLQIAVIITLLVRRLHWTVVTVTVSAGLLYGVLLPTLTLLSR